MASITIRNLDDGLKRRLRTLARPSIAGSLRWAVWIWTCRLASRCQSRRGSTEAAAMILIDTNVISELMRPNSAPEVLAWFGGQGAMALHLSDVGEAELRRGAAILPDGKRRHRSRPRCRDGDPQRCRFRRLRGRSCKSLE